MHRRSDCLPSPDERQRSSSFVIFHSVAPQLDKVIANLELLPLRMNVAKKDELGPRQKALADRLRKASLW